MIPFDSRSAYGEYFLPFRVQWIGWSGDEPLVRGCTWLHGLAQLGSLTCEAVLRHEDHRHLTYFTYRTRCCFQPVLNAEIEGRGAVQCPCGLIEDGVGQPDVHLPLEDQDRAAVEAWLVTRGHSVLTAAILASPGGSDKSLIVDRADWDCLPNLNRKVTDELRRAQEESLIR